MKPESTKKAAVLALALLATVLLTGGCHKKRAPWSFANSKIAGQLKKFSADKEAQARAAAAADGQDLPPEFAAYFAAAQAGDWSTLSNGFQHLSRRMNQISGSGVKDERLRGTGWAAAAEVLGVYKFCAVGGEKFFVTLGRDIIQSIPPGSIYFGGTDMGRFLITGLANSQVNGDPFFILTQNALAANDYLAYVRGMYAGKIFTLSAEDAQKCFDEYAADAQARAKAHKLKPGEQFKMVDGKPKINGVVAVMELNGWLARMIFDKNPDSDFYLEQSYPLDWMYPYLEPHSLILKINRQPQAALSPETIQADHDFWVKHLQPLLGDWLKDDTSVREVCAFAEKVHVKHSFWSFRGDRDFIESDMAQRTLSKLRGAIAGLYLWRLNADAPSDPAERERLLKAAEFALRQAVAICPYSLEAVKPYANFLHDHQRQADALLVAETAARILPHDAALRNLAQKMKE